MRRLLVIALVLVACGDDGGSGTKDAPAGGDGGPTDAARDGSTSNVDASVGPGAACSGTTCMLGSEECCLAAVSVCKPADTCPSQGFKCDGPEDCPGSVCCYPNANNGSRCEANNCQEVACHADTDCPSGTPKCCPKAFSPNYRACKTAC